MEVDEDLDLIDHYCVEESDNSDIGAKIKKTNGAPVEYSDSDDSIPLIIRRKDRSPKNIRAEFEDDPELYGIRRSHRSRRETSRFNVVHPNNNRPARKRPRSQSSGSEESSGDEWRARKRQSHRDVRRTTRGNRVDYKEQFVNDYSDLSEEEKRPTKPKSAISSDRRRDGPLVRSYASTVLSDAMSSEEVDAIEDVLASRIGRVGATGDDTTFYSENDPNKDFDAETEQGEMQYLIKWRGWSHLHNTWESDASLSARNVPNSGLRKLDNFKQYLILQKRIKKHASPEELEIMAYEETKQEEIRDDKKKIDRIITHAKSKTDAYNDYFVKWKRMEYSDATWEDGKLILQYFGAAYDSYEKRCKSDYIPKVHCEALRKRPKFIQLTSQPFYIGRGELKLRDYQLDGLNWLIRAWTRGNSVILADEMGLGKTIQTISFLSYLFYEHAIYGPFLLVVPLSTVSNWQNEFQKWAPDMNVITYLGNTTSRQIIRDYEWHMGSKKSVKFNVCISTYEIVRKDRSWLSSVKWAFLGVDEAHCLKNDSSELYKTLISFDANCKLLITGTPLQNSLRELWALLHFIMPNKFENFDEFEQRFDVSNGSFTDVNGMHSVLQPFLLRRVKKDVEKSLPEKTELILRIDMSSSQKQMYKLILARNYEALNKGNMSKKSSFLNIVMELKKCCNHPRLIFTAEEIDVFERKSIEERLRTIIKSSGKMMALDKLLYRFKSNGNRVLIFSQMVRMLDLIASYMSLRGWAFQRLDGTIQGEQRKQAIEHFNAEGSTDFCFLLSTRAGGLGVNLATADTVIIFDSDWNPQNDLQAQARAHRIGQTKQVSVYRFVIKKSVEEKIIERAKQKMVLEHLVIQRMDARGTNNLAPNDFSKDELNAILRFGAEELFKEDDGTENDDVDIDDILKAAESRDVEAEAEKQNPASDLLKQFKFVEFDLQEDEDVVYVDKAGQAKSWSDIIPETVRRKVKEEEDQKKILDLELGPRIRNQRVDLSKKMRRDEVEDDDDDSSSSSSTQRKKRSFSDKAVRSLIKAMRKFPRPLERVTDIITEAELPNDSDAQVKELMKTIIDGCEKVLAEPMKTEETEESNKKTNRGPMFQLGKIHISAKSIIQCIKDLEILHLVMPKTEEERRKYCLPFSPKIVSWDCAWEPDDDAKLLVGIYEKGFENWDAIKMDPSLGFTMKILPSLGNKRPQASHLRTRVEYLMKELRQRTFPPANKPPPVEKKPVKTSEKKDASSKKILVKPLNNIKSDEFVNTSESSDSSDEGDKKENGVSKKIAIDSPPRSEPVPKKKHKKSKPHKNVGLSPELNRQCVVYFQQEKSLFKVLEQADEERMKSPDVINALIRIGDRIKQVLSAMEKEQNRDVREWREHLWQFVSQFTCLDVRSIHHIYKDASKNTKRHKSDGKSSHHSHTSSQPHRRHHHHHHHHSENNRSHSSERPGQTHHSRSAKS